MAIERLWERVSPIAFTADGGQDGLVTVSSVECLKVKQTVKITAIGQPTLKLEVKRVASPTQLYVGPIQNSNRQKGNKNLLSRTDLSAYTVANSAQILAAEQSKPRLKPEDIIQASYEQEPTLALRSYLVDKVGKAFGSSENPVNITGSLEVDLETPNKQSIQNITLPTANTEVSVSLPSNTKRYRVKVRKHTALVNLAFVSGETSTNYWTISRGTVFDSADLDFESSETIYLSASKANTTIEIITWNLN